MSGIDKSRVQAVFYGLIQKNRSQRFSHIGFFAQAVRQISGAYACSHALRERLNPGYGFYGFKRKIHFFITFRTYRKSVDVYKNLFGLQAVRKTFFYYFAGYPDFFIRRDSRTPAVSGKSYVNRIKKPCPRHYKI